MKVLITGGTGSVGQALIEEFSKNKNYDIVFTYYNNKKRAEKIMQSFKVQSLYLDDPDKIDGTYDVIINNAGIVNSLVKCENIKLDDWNQTLQVNLTLPFLIIKKNLPYMKLKKWGRIINISSIYGIKAEEDVTPYTVSKHGLLGLTKSVAKEYASYGITCNAICPGTIESEMSNRLADYYTSNEEEKKEYFKELINAIPAKRLAKPIDVAKAALFLASEDTSYINGTIIVLDGGYSA